MNMAELCRQYTDLSTRKIGRLECMRTVFPFLADLAHGQLKVYVPAKVAGKLVIIAQERPHTIYMSKRDGCRARGSGSGRMVRSLICTPMRSTMARKSLA